jgi:hypothetical protein
MLAVKSRASLAWPAGHEAAIFSRQAPAARDLYIALKSTLAVQEY